MKKEIFRKLLIIGLFLGASTALNGGYLVYSQVGTVEALSEVQEISSENVEKENNILEEENLEEVEVLEEVEDIVEEEVLKEVHFNSQNVLEISNVTEEQLYRALEGTALYELTPIYIEAEQLYGVNALFIVSLTAQESAWGTSDRAVYDNNLTGFGVYSASSEGINAQSKRDNILKTTAWLKEAYLSETGDYFNGHSIRSINKSYCLDEYENPDYHWSNNITSIGFDLLSEIKAN